MADANHVVFRHINRNDLERSSRPESGHKGNLKRLKTSSVGGFERWEKENELLWAMLEDETEWLAKLFPDIIITPELFFYTLEDGVVLCRLANLVQETADEYAKKNNVNVPAKGFKFHKSIPKKNKQLALFKSRENVQAFLTWCRQIGISDSILFESNDVVEADECREGCREVVICLMEIARRASGMFKFNPIPKLIQLEKEIEIEEQREAEEESSVDQVDYVSSEDEESNESPGTSSPPPGPEKNQYSSSTDHGGMKKKNRKHALKSELDKEVFKIIDNLNFYNIRKIKEGKYMILGKIIFVRMLNGHVLLRIGGGWDTLEHYLLTHLPKAAASESGNCSNETVAPSVSKTPQKSQLTKILDKVKKEQQLKATPSPYRAAGTNGSTSDGEDDEKDITSAIRKIEFSVNQNIATRRKISKHSLEEDTPQKSPPYQSNSHSAAESNGSVKHIKSTKTPKKIMDSMEHVHNDPQDMFTVEKQHDDDTDVLSQSSLDKNKEESFSNERNEETGDSNGIDTIDRAVFADVAAPEINIIDVNSKDVVSEEDKLHEEKQFTDKTEADNPHSSETPAALSSQNLESENNLDDKQNNKLEFNTNDPNVDQTACVNQSESSHPISVGVHDDPNNVPTEESAVIPTISAETCHMPESSSSSTTPDCIASPTKSSSPPLVDVECQEKKPAKITKSKPGVTKSSAASRPKSGRPPSGRLGKNESSTVTKPEKPTSVVKLSIKSSTTEKTKPKTTSKPASTTTGKRSTTKPASGKASPTSGKASPTSGKTAVSDLKPSTVKRATRVTTSRPVKSTAFGSTVSSAPSKKAASKPRPVTAPPPSTGSMTTKAKKTVAPKVQSWSSTATRPQSARLASKPKDVADGVVASKERPTKPLVRKTQTRTVTTTKTTRVGAGGEHETKSQTLKTTRTTTEMNGKKTTKTTVKELSSTGRKPLRITTEKTEMAAGSKKPTKTSVQSKTATAAAAKAAKPGVVKATSKTATKNKEPMTELKAIPKAKTVKELSNALGITKPLKEKEGKEIDVEVKERSEKEESQEIPLPETRHSPQPGEDLHVEKTSVDEEIPLQGDDVIHESKEVTEERKEVIEERKEVTEGFPEDVIAKEPKEIPDQVEVSSTVEYEGVTSGSQVIAPKQVENERDEEGNVKEKYHSEAEEDSAQCFEDSNNNENVIDTVPTATAESPNDTSPQLSQPLNEDNDIAEDLIETLNTVNHDSLDIRPVSELEDENVDVVTLPESETRQDHSMEASEAWTVITDTEKSGQSAVDLVTVNNNVETGEKLDPGLTSSKAALQDNHRDESREQNIFDKSEDWRSAGLEINGEPTNKDSGFQESINTVDNILG